MKHWEEKQKYVFLETFGCQMNESDSERILGQLDRMNYIPTDMPESADLILLNTCSIREKAENKVYSALGRFKALKRKRPGLIIGVGGCVAQQSGDRLFKRAGYLDIVFGTSSIHKLPELIHNAVEKRKRCCSVGLTKIIDPDEFNMTRRIKSGVKAFVTIMRGCNNYCSYCIVPYVRGREVSRKANNIVAEVEELAANGVKEITLIGQNVNSYNDSGVKFTDLLDMVCGVEGIYRIRFTTSHPKDFSDKLIELIAENGKICSHLHLPLQSGSDNVLRRMRRGYCLNDYISKIDRLRQRCTGIAVTTDIIVGFPGEKEADFYDTMEAVKLIGFDSIFSFKYSLRPGTRAEHMPDHLSEEIKSERLLQLQRLQSVVSLKKNMSMVGSYKDVLVEGPSRNDNTELTGRTSCNKIVNFNGESDWIGSIKELSISDASLNSLRGEAREVILC